MRRNCLLNVHEFGDRLLAERNRVGLSQSACGQLAGVQRLTQSRYEAQVNLPDIDYLAAVEQAGFDVLFLLNGCRHELVLRAGETSILAQCIDLVTALAHQQGHVLSTEQMLASAIRTFDHVMATSSQASQKGDAATIASSGKHAV